MMRVLGKILGYVATVLVGVTIAVGAWYVTSLLMSPGHSERKAVSGTVLLDGEPLPKGVISFRPEENQPYNSGANIMKGRFAIPASQGLSPGKYRVRINASARNLNLPPPANGELDMRPGVEIIPRQYNSDSSLYVNVLASAPNEFMFELVSR